MAITLGSALKPKTGQTYYLMEDIYLKGGYQVFSTTSERDAVAEGSRKAGMLVYCADQDKIFKLGSDLLTWTELALGGSGDTGTGSTGGIYFQIVANEAERDLIPEANKKVGMLVSCSETGKIYKLVGDLVTWEELSSDVTSRSRQVATHTQDLAAGESVEFALELGASCLVLRLSTSEPILVEAFGDSDRTESNPYAFLSTSDHLEDDGSMMFADGTILRTRRFSVLANLENTPTNYIYFRLTNLDQVSKSVNLTVVYLVLEKSSYNY